MGGIIAAQREEQTGALCVEVVWIVELPHHTIPALVTLAPSFFYFFALVPVDSAHSCAKWLLRHDIVGVDPGEESERAKVYRA